MMITKGPIKTSAELSQLRTKVEAMPKYIPLAIEPGNPNWPKNVEAHGTIPDLLIVKHTVHIDPRGETEAPFIISQVEAILGQPIDIRQNLRSWNKLEATGRGAHAADYRKMTECSQGRVEVVVLDVRSSSPSYMKIGTVILEPAHGKKEGVSLCIPAGCAHAYITLLPNSTYQYMQSAEWTPEAEVGFNLLDPLFTSRLTVVPKILSDKDQKNVFASVLLAQNVSLQ